MLGDEVFDKWPTEVQEFLVHTSFLNKLNGSLCEAVTGSSESGTLLTRLSRYNSFIISLDQQNHWFRYHHLFQEFLIQKLNKKNSAGIRVLYCRAGQWYEENDNLAEAINYYLKAEE